MNSNWLKKYLNWLGIIFEIDKKYDMMKILKKREEILNCQWIIEYDKNINNYYKILILINYQDLYWSVQGLWNDWIDKFEV